MYVRATSYVHTNNKIKVIILINLKLELQQNNQHFYL